MAIQHFVIPTGVEPVIFGMKARRPRPLDDGTRGDTYCSNKQ